VIVCKEKGLHMLDVNRRRYFAYGSNMDRQQRRDRYPGAVLLGTARLLGYRFIINCAGVASVVSTGCHEVFGVLWEITATDEGALDDYEGLMRDGIIRPYCP
jgi:gamma-glutamylcyclotransferase